MKSGAGCEVPQLAAQAVMLAEFTVYVVEVGIEAAAPQMLSAVWLDERMQS